MDFSFDFTDLKEVLENSDGIFDGKFFGDITDESLDTLTNWDSAYSTYLSTIDALPETTDEQKTTKWQAYVNLYSGDYETTFTGNFTLFRVATTVPFVHLGVSYQIGDMIFWYAGSYYTLDQLEADTSFEWDKKFLSVFLNRFFSTTTIEEYPNFVEFMREWMRYCETEENVDGVPGFYSIISNISDWSDIEKIPNNMLQYQLEQLAPSFRESFNKIPYFYSDDEIQYDSVRNFIRICRLWQKNRASLDSLHHLFHMLMSRARVVVASDMMLRLSDYSDNFSYNEQSVSGSAMQGNITDLSTWSQSGVTVTSETEFETSGSGWLRLVTPMETGNRYVVSFSVTPVSGSGSVTVYDGKDETGVLLVSGESFVCANNGWLFVKISDALVASMTVTLKKIHAPQTIITHDYDIKSHISMRPEDSDVTMLFHLHGKEDDPSARYSDEDAIIWGPFSVVVYTDHDLTAAKRVVDSVWRSCGVGLSFKRSALDPDVGWGTEEFGNDEWGSED